MRIPKIGVDAALSYQKVSPEGSMPNPPSDQVGIYDFSGLAPSAGGPDGSGGNPGRGNTVLAGAHSNSKWSASLLQPRHRDGGRHRRAERWWQNFHLQHRSGLHCGGDGLRSRGTRRTDREALTLITDTNNPRGGRLYVVAEREPGSIGRECPAGTPVTSGTSAPSQPANPPSQSGPSGILQFDSRLPPGSLEGALAGSLVYRFRITGSGNFAQATYTLSSQGQPDREVRVSFRNNVIDVPFPSSLPPGRYTLTLRLSDGRTFSAEFDHTQDSGSQGSNSAPPPQPSSLQSSQPAKTLFPAAIEGMMAKLAVPDGLALQLAASPADMPSTCSGHGGCYIPTQRLISALAESNWDAPQPGVNKARTFLGSLGHEVCHTHQHWRIAASGLAEPGPEGRTAYLNRWLQTDEGQCICFRLRPGRQH